MPIPSPGKDEKQDAFISRCISAVKEADPDREQDQVVAMCYSAWRDAKKEKHKEAPFSGDATVDERLGWLEDDLRSLWMKIDAVGQRIDDLIAMGASKMNSKIVHIESFLWQDGIVSPCGLAPCVKFKSFKWVPELKVPDWATGRLYLFSTLESPKAADGKVFDDAQKNRCAASLIGAPVNIDHEKYDLVGQNVVLDAEVEDARMEGLCYVEDPQLNKLYDDGEIAGCSIEWFDKPVPLNTDGTQTVKGTKCVGLAFCTKSHLSKGYVLGDPLSSVKAMATEIASLKETVAALTIRFNALPGITVTTSQINSGTITLAGLQAMAKPKKPKEYENVPDDEFADTENWKYPIDAEHVMAAWAYINQDDNQGDYSDDKWAAMKAKVKAAMKKYGHEVETLPDAAFAFVGDGERKLQMKTAEDKYDETLLRAATTEMAMLLPPAAVPDAKAKLRAGFVALGLPVPEELAEATIPLAAALDPRIARKLQHSIDRRERYKERFHIWAKEDLE